MHKTSTPLNEFHATIRAIIDDEDHERHTAFKINEKIKAVVSLGKVPGYKISSDGSSAEPALTPESDQKSFALLVNKTALLFPKSLTKDRISSIEMDIHDLENEQGLIGW